MLKVIQHNNKLIVGLSVFIILSVMGGMQIFTALNESQTVDEGAHLGAGYSYLIKRDFRLNKEHPPLIKEISAFPLLFFKKLNNIFNDDSWVRADQWQFARNLIYKSGENGDLIVFLGRLPNILISVLLGLFIFAWSRRLFGITGGFISLIFYSFDSNFLAHGHYITTDVGVTFFILLTFYFFCKYLNKVNLKDFVLFSLFFSLAQVSKFSAILLIPILLFILFWILLNKFFRTQLNKIFSNWQFKIILFLLIVLSVILISYSFESKKLIDNPAVNNFFNSQENILQKINDPIGQNKFNQLNKIIGRESALGKVVYSFSKNVPVPGIAFIEGAFQLLIHNEAGHTSYLFGNYSRFGWWYYFPAALIIKTTLPFLILLILLIIHSFYYLIKNSKYISYLSVKKNEITVLIIVPLLYFIFSMFSNLNLGVRHILPIFPFIYILFGSVVNLKIFNKKIIKNFIVVLLFFHIFTTLINFPNFTSYINELFGGPKNGYKYLVDSNLDWGQDLKKLKKYMTEKNINNVCFSYFGQAEISYYKIDYRYLPGIDDQEGIENINCVVAISITSLTSEDRKYSWLLDLELDDYIGFSIFIYDLRNLKK